MTLPPLCRNQTEVNVCEILEVNTAPFALKASIAARVLLKRADLSFVLSRSWQMHMSPCVFQLFFQPVFCWPWWILVPAPLVKTRGLNKDFSMSVTLWLCLSFFSMLLVDLLKGLFGIRLWGRMCDPYVKKCFLIAISQSSRRNIQPCIVSSVDVSFKIIFIDWQKCGFYLNIFQDPNPFILLTNSQWWQGKAWRGHWERKG